MILIAVVIAALILGCSMSVDKIATFIVGLLIFVAGLLAWRLQLLDKRKFEVAEQVVTVSSKVAEAIRVLRTRHDMNGFVEAESLGPRAIFRAKRRFYYGIPEAKLRAFEEVYKELAPTMVLARLYLSDAIASRMETLQFAFEAVKYAAYKLGQIDPEHPGDILFLPGDRPPLDQPEEPDDTPSDEEMIKIQDEELEVRFLPFLSLDQDEDDLSQRITTMGRDLDRLCRPYKSVDPWRFLARFVSMFMPGGEDDDRTQGRDV